MSLINNLNDHEMASHIDNTYLQNIYCNSGSRKFKFKYLMCHNHYFKTITNLYGKKFPSSTK